MAIHRILDDFYQPNYTLIAIHSYLEDYRLAYFLNLYLKAKFQKARYSIDFDNQASYSLFEWEDIYLDTEWSLISNTSVTEVETDTAIGLFESNTATVTNYLIPEHKNVDYFLKISNEDNFTKTGDTLEKIKKISQVTTAYMLDPNQLKSKNNLIF
ncbi:IPExxxVDY family protein [Leptobacterium flavescens]|uniref:IPExxxVDY family protein n=1 Tax=Leptobacterium flavescens TaxID=472055 RepID=A0A6P0UV90_9FLAO|nr:IPExxxVDY family protein [Leptobacterium flavescens]NER14316.1 IPExxxVDY family protein [Leptobacterium flavescens]